MAEPDSQYRFIRPRKPRIDPEMTCQPVLQMSAQTMYRTCPVWLLRAMFGADGLVHPASVSLDVTEDKIAQLCARVGISRHRILHLDGALSMLVFPDRYAFLMKAIPGRARTYRLFPYAFSLSGTVHKKDNTPPFLRVKNDDQDGLFVGFCKSPDASVRVDIDGPDEPRMPCHDKGMREAFRASLAAEARAWTDVLDDAEEERRVEACAWPPLLVYKHTRIDPCPDILEGIRVVLGLVVEDMTRLAAFGDDPQLSFHARTGYTASQASGCIRPFAVYGQGRSSPDSPVPAPALDQVGIETGVEACLRELGFLRRDEHGNPENEIHVFPPEAGGDPHDQLIKFVKNRCVLTGSLQWEGDPPSRHARIFWRARLENTSLYGDNGPIARAAKKSATR